MDPSLEPTADPLNLTDTRRAIDAIARVRNLSADAIDKAVRTNLQTLLR